MNNEVAPIKVLPTPLGGEKHLNRCLQTCEKTNKNMVMKI